MKKLSYCVSFIALSFFGLSNSYADPFTGYYVGFFGGGSYLEGSENSQLSRQFTPEIVVGFTVPQKHAVRSNSLIGMATLGYGETFCNNGYLGAEFFVDWSNQNNTVYQSAQNNNRGTIFSLSSRIKIDPVSYGLDVRPGYKICEAALLYVRLGMAVKRVSINLVQVITTEDEINSHLTSASARGVTRAFPRVGLGFEYALTDCLNVRADYIFTYLGNFSHVDTSSRNLAAAVIQTRATSSVHLVNNAFFFGICRYW